jgi:branched-chain amino acid transport system permease protein
VIQGLIFVVIVMAFRKGLVGELGDWWKRRRLSLKPERQP